MEIANQLGIGVGETKVIIKNIANKKILIICFYTIGETAV